MQTYHEVEHELTVRVIGREIGVQYTKELSTRGLGTHVLWK